jgi:hypothetical protein
MHSDGKAYYPTRSFIRFQAKNLLIQELMNGQELTVVSRFPELGTQSLQEPEQPKISRTSDSEPSEISENDNDLSKSTINEEDHTPFSIDEMLLSEITATALQADQHPELYQGSQSQQAILDIEQAIAQDIVTAYQRILKNRTDKTIQVLNALLE